MVSGVVSQENKTAFKDLISKMNQFEDKTPIVEDKLVTNEKKSVDVEMANSRFGSGDPGMKSIVDKFNSVFVENQKKLLKEDQTLVAEPTETGVQVGSDWEIKKIIEDGIPSYEVVSLNTKKTILENVHTYLTAKTVVKYLNEGFPINSTKVKHLILLDEEVDHHFQEARDFIMRHKKTGKAIYEARSQYAKDKMISVQGQIKRISEGAI